MADGLTSKTILRAQAMRFEDMFTVIPFKVTFEDDSIVKDAIYDGGGTVAVTGAALGDYCFVAPEVDIADMELVGHVTAADVVTVLLSNNTGGTLTTLASGTVVNGFVLAAKGRLEELN
jgi:hypothetical protein